MNYNTLLKLCKHIKMGFKKQKTLKLKLQGLLVWLRDAKQ